MNNNHLVSMITRPVSRARTPARLSIIEEAFDLNRRLSSSMAPSNPKPSVFKRFSHSKPAVDHRSPSALAKSKVAMMKEKLLSEGYTEDEIKEFSQVFSLFDTDDSGSIGTTELANAMRSMGMNPGQDELENLINEVDADGNGEIDFEEFCGVMKRMYRSKVGWDDIVKQCFTVFDRSGAGFITELEFQHVLRHVGEIDDEMVLETLFSEFDVDGNGLIDYDEFTNMVKHFMTEEDVESCQ